MCRLPPADIHKDTHCLCCNIRALECSIPSILSLFIAIADLSATYAPIFIGNYFLPVLSTIVDGGYDAAVFGTLV